VTDPKPPTWLRDIAPPPPERHEGRIPPPHDIPPVVREKKPRAEMRRTNRERQGRVKPLRVGEQAKRCGDAPCAACGVKGLSVPHHWPTVAAGGLDRDTMPLCGWPKRLDGEGCHEAFHDKAGSPEAFLESHGCDVYAAIERMRKGAPKATHRCEDYPVPREDVRREESWYECGRCGARIPDEQEDAPA
jgi:hypothetical protein